MYAIMEFRRPILSALVLVALFALSSVVSLKLSFEVPEITNLLIFETCTSLNFYEPAIIKVPQNKIFVDACHKVITREPIMTYLEKQTKSPPL